MELINSFIGTLYFLPITLLFLGITFYILERNYAKEIFFVIIFCSFVPISLILCLIFCPDNISFSLFFWSILCIIGIILFLMRNIGKKMIIWTSTFISSISIFLIVITSLQEIITALVAALITGIFLILTRRFILSLFIKLISILLIISSVFMFDLLQKTETIIDMPQTIIDNIKQKKILEAIAASLRISDKFDIINWGKLLGYTFIILIVASIIKNIVFSKKAIKVKQGEGTLRIINLAEKKYFFILCTATVIIFITFVFLPIYISMIAFEGLILLFAVSFIKSNAVKAGEKQFTEIYKIAKECSEKINLDIVPEIYIINDNSQMEAYTIRALKNNAVVLSSETANLAIEGGEDVIKFVLFHEIAHIKHKHAEKLFWLWPLATILFPIGKAYMRACEYTCDAYGAYFVPNGTIKGIIAIAIGTKLFGKVDAKEFLKQFNNNKDIFTLLAEFTSTHPFLGKRLESIYKIANTSNKELAEIEINLS